MSKWGSSADYYYKKEVDPEATVREAYANILRNLAWKIEFMRNDVTGEYVCFIPKIIKAKILRENLDFKLVLECFESEELENERAQETGSNGDDRAQQ